jgi:hypothetical protein
MARSTKVDLGVSSSYIRKRFKKIRRFIESESPECREDARALLYGLRATADGVHRDVLNVLFQEAEDLFQTLREDDVAYLLSICKGLITICRSWGAIRPH